MDSALPPESSNLRVFMKKYKCSSLQILTGAPLETIRFFVKIDRFISEWQKQKHRNLLYGGNSE